MTNLIGCMRIALVTFTIPYAYNVVDDDVDLSAPVSAKGDDVIHVTKIKYKTMCRIVIGLYDIIIVSML